MYNMWILKAYTKFNDRKSPQMNEGFIIFQNQFLLKKDKSNCKRPAHLLSLYNYNRKLIKMIEDSFTIAIIGLKITTVRRNVSCQ